MPPRHFSLFPQRTWARALSILVAAWFGELLAEGGEPFVEQQGPPFARWTWIASASGTYVNQVSPDRNDAVPVNQPVMGQGVLQMDGGKTGDPADDRYVEVGQLSPPMSGATYMQWTFLDLMLPDSPDGQSQVLAGSLQSGFGPGTTFTITANEDRDDTAADGLADISLSLFVNPEEGLKAESVTARARNVIAIATRVGLRITYAGAGRGQSKGTVAVEILAPQESEWTPVARTKIDVGQINGPRGKAKLVEVKDNELTLSYSWEDNTPALYPIDLWVSFCRPQTCRKVIQECTSLGVRSITFFSTEKCEPGYRKSRLWSTGESERLLIRGTEQAFCTQVPELTLYSTLEEVIETKSRSGILLALDNYEASVALGCNGPNPSQVTLAVGGERGWSKKEREILRASGFTLVHLGPRVLRTETACIASISIIRSQMMDRSFSQRSSEGP